jgi:hypothetical protein
MEVETRTIGARIHDGVHFRYLTDTNELEIELPRAERTVSGYANGKRFTETQFKVMCCRFSDVTRDTVPPSTFRGNTLFNPDHWNPPDQVFANVRIDPPYVVAVVRKVLEDNLPLDHAGYCPCQNNCK